MNPDTFNEDYEPPVPDADLAIGAPRPLFILGLLGGAAALGGLLWWAASSFTERR